MAILDFCFDSSNAFSLLDRDTQQHLIANVILLDLLTGTCLHCAAKYSCRLRMAVAHGIVPEGTSRGIRRAPCTSRGIRSVRRVALRVVYRATRVAYT